MPETAPGALPTFASHVNAAQWQSFEMRMRQRRAARLILRAQTALEQGLVQEAETALEEARTLDSSAPDVETLRARITPSELPVPTPSPTPVTSASPASRSVAAKPELAVPSATRVAPVEPVLRVPEDPAGSAVAPTDTIRPALGSPVSVLPLWDLGDVETTPDREEAPRRRSVRVPLAIAASVVLVTMLALWSRSARLGPGPAPVSAAAVATKPALPHVADTTAALVTTGTTGAAAPAIERQPIEPSALTPAVTAGDNLTASLPEAAPTAPAIPERPVNPVEALREERAEPAASLPVREGVDTIGPAAATVLEPPALAAPPPPAPVEAQPGPVDESPSVRRVLSQYEAAYSSLDAAAARRVWPTLDDRALSRAFDALQSQHVALGRCEVSVAGPAARAECHGSAQWTPKVGGGSRTEAREWSFDLRKTGGEWRIVDAIVR